MTDSGIWWRDGEMKGSSFIQFPRPPCFIRLLTYYCTHRERYINTSAGPSKETAVIRSGESLRRRHLSFRVRSDISCQTSRRNLDLCVTLQEVILITFSNRSDIVGNMPSYFQSDEERDVSFILNMKTFRLAAGGNCLLKSVRVKTGCKKRGLFLLC